MEAKCPEFGYGTDKGVQKRLCEALDPSVLFVE